MFNDFNYKAGYVITKIICGEKKQKYQILFSSHFFLHLLDETTFSRVDYGLK